MQRHNFGQPHLSPACLTPVAVFLSLHIFLTLLPGTRAAVFVLQRSLLLPLVRLKTADAELARSLQLE
jgi:hypothetical protein